MNKVQAWSKMELTALDGSDEGLQVWRVSVGCESTLSRDSHHSKVFSKECAKEACDWMTVKIKEVESNDEFLNFTPY